MSLPFRYQDVEISDDEHHFLSHPSRLHRENRFSDAEDDVGAEVISRFIGLYAVSQCRAANMAEKDLQRLIESDRAKVVIRLGSSALNEVLSEDLLEADRLYEQAVEAGMVTHFTTTPSQEIRKLMPSGKIAAYSYTLQEHLRELYQSGELEISLQNRGE